MLFSLPSSPLLIISLAKIFFLFCFDKSGKLVYSFGSETCQVLPPSRLLSSIICPRQPPFSRDSLGRQDRHRPFSPAHGPLDASRPQLLDHLRLLIDQRHQTVSLVVVRTLPDFARPLMLRLSSQRFCSSFISPKIGHSPSISLSPISRLGHRIYLTRSSLTLLSYQCLCRPLYGWNMHPSFLPFFNCILCP